MLAKPFLLVFAAYVLPLILKVIFLPFIALPLDVFNVALYFLTLYLLKLLLDAFKICLITILFDTLTPLYSAVIVYFFGFIPEILNVT